MNNPLAFLAFISLAWGIMYAMHLVVYIPISRVFNVHLPHWPVALGLIAFSYFIASFAVRNIQHFLADWLYFAAATWLGVIFITFSLVALYEIIHLITGFDSRYLLGGLLILSLGLSIYALLMGRYLIVKEYTIPIANLTKPIRVAHLTDIHVGTVHQTKYLERVVSATNELKPDLVLITGDLFDGSAPIDEEILTPLNNLSAPSFFSNGNHEEYEGLELVRNTVQNLDLQLLENSFVTHSGLQIIGVNDRQSLPKDQTLDVILASLDLNPVLPSILMYHTPVEWEAARKHNIDLTLSGHTHNGQVYPFTLLVRMAFKYINGLYEEDGKYIHVSPGTGTWGPPMRLGSKNQITILNLEPKQ